MYIVFQIGGGYSNSIVKEQKNTQNLSPVHFMDSTYKFKDEFISDNHTVRETLQGRIGLKKNYIIKIVWSV